MLQHRYRCWVPNWVGNFQIWKCKFGSGIPKLAAVLPNIVVGSNAALKMGFYTSLSSVPSNRAIFHTAVIGYGQSYQEDICVPGLRILSVGIIRPTDSASETGAIPAVQNSFEGDVLPRSNSGKPLDPRYFSVLGKTSLSIRYKEMKPI